MKNPLAILIISAFVVLLSCNNKTVPAEGSSWKDDLASIRCYRYASENDTIYLKFLHIGKGIRGVLDYKLKEKDRNSGTIAGKMDGDLMIADYTFMSEGQVSVRQVVFKKQGHTMIEGYGEVEEVKGKPVFKNLNSLQFNSDFKLMEVDCEQSR
jgi:hypothetical protein